MAYAKKKNPKYTSWKRAHLKRHNTPEASILAKHTVSTIIILSMIVVVLAIFFGFLTNPERLAKATIENLARDYYENYFYKTIVSANEIGTANEKKSLAEIMEKYEKIGFAKVTLRQLLLYNPEKAGNPATTTNYCDENATSVQIFPTAPYGKSDYKIEYNYTSCSF